MSGNAVQMTRGAGPFYETWYLTFVHAQSGQAFWLRATLLASPKGGLVPLGGLWLARFDPKAPARNLALSESYDVYELDFHPGQTGIEIGPGLWREGHTSANFTSQGHKVSWELNWTPPHQTLRLLPELVTRHKLNRSDLCVPGVDISIAGRISIDGEALELRECPGGQAHHWGRHYPKSWIWGHCNAFPEAPGAWVEMLAVKLFDWRGHSWPLVMLALQTPSRRLAIVEPWQMALARANYCQGRFCISFAAKSTRVQLSFRAEREHFVRFPYTSPTDETYYCHNSCVAACDLQIFEQQKGREHLVEELRAENTAAAEFCTREETGPERFRF